MIQLQELKKMSASAITHWKASTEKAAQEPSKCWNTDRF